MNPNPFTGFPIGFGKATDILSFAGFPVGGLSGAASLSGTGQPLHFDSTSASNLECKDYMDLLRNEDISKWFTRQNTRDGSATGDAASAAGTNNTTTTLRLGKALHQRAAGSPSDVSYILVIQNARDPTQHRILICSDHVDAGQEIFEHASKQCSTVFTAAITSSAAEAIHSLKGSLSEDLLESVEFKRIGGLGVPYHVSNRQKWAGARMLRAQLQEVTRIDANEEVMKIGFIN